MKNNSFEDLIPTRRSLLSRLKDWGDTESWREFFDTYWKLIYGVSLRAGLTETEAQDVVQETIIGVSKKMPEFKYDPAIGSFKGWLLTMTRWRIKDQFRKRERDSRQQVTRMEDEVRTSAVEQIADPAGCDLDNIWDEEWEQAIMNVAIERTKAKVNAKHYQVFDLCVMKKWAVEKIAATLGIRPGDVYVIKHRVSNVLAGEIKALEDKLI